MPIDIENHINQMNLSDSENKFVENYSPSIKDGTFSSNSSIDGSFNHELKKPSSFKHKEKLGLKLLADQKMNHYRKSGYDFNIMTIGNQGCGKSTFINTLFNEEIIEDSQSSTKPFKVYKAHLTEQNFTLRLTILETSGNFEEVNLQNKSFSSNETKRYLESQFRSYMFQEEQPDRSQINDGRIHLCIYFIQPIGTSISKYDLRLMKEICESVNVIPVIARCDTFTKNDRILIKQNFKNDIIEQDISICDLIVDHSVTEKIHKSMPFGVIGSDEVSLTSDGREVRGRKYDWGIAEVDNVDHCDFTLLKEIILCENTLDLIFSTVSHYDKYRQKALIERFNSVQQKNSSATLADEDVGENISSIDVTNKTIVDQLKFPKYSSDIPLNGFEQLKIFHQCSLKEVEANLYNIDDLLFELESRIKIQYSAMSKEQDLRFREWRNGLQERQNGFNSKLKLLSDTIIRLENEISALEAN